MRLAAFIRSNIQPIASEWESFARTLTPAADNMSPLALRDHIQQILAFVANDLESAQTESEQVEKSRGEKVKHPAVLSIAEVHASLRHEGGFNMDQMVSEYRALRASVIKLWDAQLDEVTRNDIVDLTRFNEAIDQLLTESISDYSRRLEHSRNMFLGILSHDIRSPLGATRMSAELTLRMGGENLSKQQTMLVSQVIDCTDRATEIVNHLLDLTRVRLGSGIPVVKAAMDMGQVARQLVKEMQIRHPERRFLLEVSGNTDGEWDKARIGQVLSNLIDNAVQYGFPENPVTIEIIGEADEVVLSVHNDGTPIPAHASGRIFQSLTRGGKRFDQEMDAADGSINLGLGLYITREIVSAHGGSIGVTSSEEEGTTFTASFPRHFESSPSTEGETAHRTTA